MPRPRQTRPHIAFKSSKGPGSILVLRQRVQVLFLRQRVQVLFLRQRVQVAHQAFQAFFQHMGINLRG